jgi:hypothetical protein
MRILAARALAWIDAHRADFRLTSPTIEGVKRLGELAIMASVVDPGGGERLAWAWEQLGAGDAIAALVPAQVAIGCVYVPFRRAGLRSRAVELALADPRSRRGVAGSHWFVRFGVGMALEAIGVPPPWPMVCPGAFSVSEHPLAAELAAHVVMWRTDMGREPLAIAGEDRARLAAAIPAWSTRLAAAGEWDALAEVAIAAACARLPIPDLVGRALAGAQRDDGSLPLLRDARPGFATSYHATLVAVIAGRLAADAPEHRRAQAQLVAETYAAYCD